MASARFAAPVSDTTENEFRLARIPEKTRQITDWGIRAWNEWAAARGASTSEAVTDHVPVATPLLQMTGDDFAYWLGKFVLEVRKADGGEYPPKSLYALVCCFKRYFEANGVHDINLINSNDPRFGGFRQTLDAEMQRWHASGLGTKKKQAEPISPDEEAILWLSGQLGCHSAEALLNTVYYYNCKVFGLRSYDEHRNLQCKQFEKKLDERGRVYLEYTDCGSKTNRGGLKHMKVENKTVRQYENVDDSQHCIVNIFEFYFSLIPSRDSHFYFRPSKGLKFARQPVGRNKIAKLIPDMCKAARIEGYKTGHSGKVTCATTLYREGFSDQLIKERTGHRSLEALHQYKRTGSQQQQDLSMALGPSISGMKPNFDKENVKPKCDSDDDDFVPLKKKAKLQPEIGVPTQGMFPHSCMNQCTFNITIQK